VKRRGHPAIHAVVTADPGEANSHRISVTLPRGELLDNSHIGTVCVRADFAAGTCPERSKIGDVEVITPLLDHPLAGSVYLRASQHRLPDMALDLRGQFDIEAIGRVTSYHSSLRTIFETIPDAPVSKIRLNLEGGSKGLVVNSESLCLRPKRAMVKMTGQNGVTTVHRTRLKTNCGRKVRHRSRHHTRAGSLR
jgi:hypothetical protein